jgi:hypothetical protein
MNWTLPSLTTPFTTRDYHDGTVLANRLGLQLARAFVMQARVRRARRERPRPSHPAFEMLLRDGIAVLPRFLPDEVFASVRAEFEAARRQGLLKPAPCVEDNGVVEDTAAVGKNRQHFPVIWREFGENQALRELVGDIIGETPRNTALVLSVMRKSTEPTAPTRLIGSNYIHADTHFPTVKAWLYLNDIDETNGALVYAPGSHRLSWGRLLYEYEASIRVARSKVNGAVHTSVPYGLVRMPRPEQLKRMGIAERSTCAKANTLVIANTMGFHRRGEFQPDTTRNLLMLRFGDRGGKIKAARA